MQWASVWEMFCQAIGESGIIEKPVLSKGKVRRPTKKSVGGSHGLMDREEMSALAV